MVDGGKPAMIPDELFERAQEYYKENKEELKLKEGVRSLTGFIGHCIREYMKSEEII